MIITFEGYVLPQRYIIRECTIIFDDRHYQHFHFKLPDNLNLTKVDNRTIKYCTKYLNELPLGSLNVLPYSTLDVILKSLDGQKVFVAGSAAFSFASTKMTKSTVIDTCQENNLKYPSTLPSEDCFKSHNPRYCSLSKAKFIQKFLKEHEVEY